MKKTIGKKVKKFIEARIFKEKHDIHDFKITQKELLFKEYLPGGKINFHPVEVLYDIKFNRSHDFSMDKVPLILPIKDMSKLLKYTLNNLVTNSVYKFANIVVVDDRSSEDLLSICKENKSISYIRVDNKKGFNYSMLANISAYIMKQIGFKEIIYWNSDMWVPNEETILKLINNHKTNECVISGTKLLYPTFSWDNSNTNISAENEIRHLGLEKDYKGKVQFGGGLILIENNMIMPMHIKRFSDPLNPIVNSNCGTFFTTGAYSMIDLQWLCDIGGFNPSLSKVYNDIDICLRAIENNNHVMYFGKDIFLYHHESLNLNNETKFDHQFNSDSILFQKLWNKNRIKGILK